MALNPNWLNLPSQVLDVQGERLHLYEKRSLARNQIRDRTGGSITVRFYRYSGLAANDILGKNEVVAFYE